MPIRELWAEMLGKATGASKGRGGPMHISAPDQGLMLCTRIVPVVASRWRRGSAWPRR